MKGNDDSNSKAGYKGGGGKGSRKKPNKGDGNKRSAEDYGDDGSWHDQR